MKKYIALLLFSCCLFGCNSETEEIESQQPITLQTTGKVMTRSHDYGGDSFQGFRSGDMIGLFCKSEFGDYMNACYMLRSSHRNFQWMPISGREIMVRYSKMQFDITGYFPYIYLEEGEETIDVNTRDQKQRASLDYMFASRYHFNTNDGGEYHFNHPLRFRHKMAKVRLIIKPGSHTTLREIKSSSSVYRLTKLVQDGTFNVKTGGLTRDSDTSSETVTINARPHDTSEARIYDLYYLPQMPEWGRIQLYARINNRNYTVNLDIPGSGHGLFAGSLYQFEIKI